jgi:hypothetical protein
MTAILLVGLTVSAATASEFKRIQKTSNRKVTALRGAMKALVLSDYVLMETYKVTKKSAAHGRTPEQLSLDILKEALQRRTHGAFDEGITLRTVYHSAAGARFAVLALRESEENGDLPWSELQTALEKALTDRTVDVRVGTATGADVMAAILAVYDTVSDEVSFLVFSNEQL